MKWQRIVPTLVLAVFAVDTVLVVAEHGYLGFYEKALANTATQLMGFDLVIALTLCFCWMAADARKLQRSVWPFALLTLIFGAAGPLAYLATRSEEAATSKRSAAAPIRQAAH